jgi:hypothetical protein
VSISYSIFAINYRLLGVVTATGIGGNGSLRLYAGSTLISTISLANPCGNVDGGVLTFTGTLLDPSAANTGKVDSGSIYNGVGNLIASGLKAGIPLSGADIIISNGLNSTLITAGQVVQVLSAQITGS